MKRLTILSTLLLTLMILLSSFAYSGFLDADKDGIQDSDDKCPFTDTDQVDSSGCSCSQKLEASCYGYWCCNPGYYCLDAKCLVSGQETQEDFYTPSEFTWIVYADVEKNDVANKIHRKIVDRMLSYDPEMIFQTGDIVRFDSWDSHWETFFDIIEPILKRGIPYYVARGDSEDGEAWDEYMDFLPGNHHYYTVEKENALYIVIDSNMDLTPGSEQYQWLENVLKNNDKEWVFLFSHFPFYNEGYHKDG